MMRGARIPFALVLLTLGAAVRPLLVFPIDWPEPFRLVMIEAMACGTPVIRRTCGSVPEILDPDRTGFLADTLDELVDAVKRIDTIDRGACRRHVERRVSRMQRRAAYFASAFRFHSSQGRGSVPATEASAFLASSGSR